MLDPAIRSSRTVRPDGSQPAYIRVDTRVDNIDTLANLGPDSVNGSGCHDDGHGTRFPLPT